MVQRDRMRLDLHLTGRRFRWRIDLGNLELAVSEQTQCTHG